MTQLWLLPVLATMVLVSTVARAQDAADSLALFQRADRVVGVLHERGNGKLVRIMEAMAPGRREFSWTSPRGDAGIACHSVQEQTSCTFTFVVSDSVQIGAKTMVAAIGNVTPDSRVVFDVSFANAKGDRLHVRMMSSSLTAESVHH